jgi:hypothetical protein
MIVGGPAQAPSPAREAKKRAESRVVFFIEYRLKNPQACKNLEVSTARFTLS